MGTWKPKPVLEGMFSAADFEDISSWLDSPAGQLSDKVNRIVCRLLRKADVDVDNRKIIWPDGQRLSISDSVSRIHASHPSLPLDMIDSHVLDWLTMEFVPKGGASGILVG